MDKVILRIGRAKWGGWMRNQEKNFLVIPDLRTSTVPQCPESCLMMSKVSCSVRMLWYATPASMSAATISASWRAGEKKTNARSESVS